MTPTEDRTDRKIHRPIQSINHKCDFGRFRVDCTKTEGDVFSTPIRGCDIFRNARSACRFFDLLKKTPRGTSATLNLGLQDRREPRPAAQNVAEKAAQIAPGRPADATRLAKAMAACPKTRAKTWPKRRPKSHQADPRTPRDWRKQWRRVRKRGPKRRPNSLRPDPRTRPDVAPTTKRPPTADPRPQT